jgi:hypothetical protein
MNLGSIAKVAQQVIIDSLSVIADCCFQEQERGGMGFNQV